MQRLVAVASVLLLVACGGDDAPPDAQLVSGETGGTGTDGGDGGGTDTATTDGDTGTTTGGDTTDTGGTGDDTSGTTGDTGTGGPTGLQLSVTPLVIDFGSTTIGKSRPGSFVLENIGDEKIEILSAALVEGGEAGFSYNDVEPVGLLVPGEKRAVDMTFVSAAVGSATGRIDLKTDPAIEPPVSIFLQAIATVSSFSVPSEIVSTVPSVGFGPIPVGDEGKLALELFNASTDPIQLTGLDWEGDPGPFGWKTFEQIPALLGPTTAIEITASFQPPGQKAYSATLVAHTDSTITPVLKIPLSGTGFSGGCAGKLVCSPGDFAFGTVWTSQPKTLTLVCRNTGLGAITVSDVDVDLSAADGFAWNTPDLPVNLTSGQGVGVQVTYTPKNLVSGASGSITVKSNDCSNGSQTIQVTGSGAEAPPGIDCAQPGSFDAKTQWEWSAPEGQPGWVRSAPIVLSLSDDDGDGDIDAQDVPDVIFVAHDNLFPDLNDDQPGVLHAVSGADGADLWSAGEKPYRPTWAGQIAGGQLDGAGAPEIVTVAFATSPAGSKCPGVPEFLPASFCSKYLAGTLLAFHGDSGEVFWESEPWTGATTDIAQVGGPTIADLDGDGAAEIVFGNHVYDGLTGAIEWVGEGGRGNDGHGFLSIVADVDGDGKPNVVAGNTAYRPNGEILWTATIGDTHATAAGDFDQDGDIEVFVNAPNGSAVVVDGASGKVVAGPITVGTIGCCAGVPAVGNVTSGSPGLEIVTLSHDHLRVYGNDLKQLWERPAKDPTGAAGVVLFDVGGDGLAEIFYADVEALDVLKGATGDSLMVAARESGTGLDLPVVADVDGDGHAEVLLTGEGDGPGLKLVADQDDQWSGARRTWNQHAWSASSIHDGGAVPWDGWVKGGPPLELRSTPALCK